MKKLIITLMMSMLCAFADKSLDLIKKNIFLGEAFSSHYAYFISFDEKSSWRDSLYFHHMNQVSQVIEAKQVAFIKACSKESFFVKQEAIKAKVDYFINPFFNTISNDCVDEKVAKYAFRTKIKEAYNVIAWSSKVELTDFSFVNSKKIRPVDISEMKELNDYKAASKKEEIKYGGCTTQPGFLDQAKIIVEFKIKSQGYSGRLSNYFDPGCGGHLSDIYILDIFKAGKFVKSFQTHHYQGVI